MRERERRVSKILFELLYTKKKKKDFFSYNLFLFFVCPIIYTEAYEYTHVEIAFLLRDNRCLCKALNKHFTEHQSKQISGTPVI